MTCGSVAELGGRVSPAVFVTDSLPANVSQIILSSASPSSTSFTLPRQCQQPSAQGREDNTLLDRKSTANSTRVLEAKAVLKWEQRFAVHIVDVV